MHIIQLESRMDIGFLSKLQGNSQLKQHEKLRI